MRISTHARLAAGLALGLAVCATAAAEDPASARLPMAADLSCALPTNCVTSLGDAGPLRYAGTAERGLALLRATLKSFPEATVTRTEGLAMEVIFTTRIGFRDQVDFRIDPQGGRIDYRSRSLFGSFDWGKNRSRMDEVRERFKQAVVEERVSSVTLFGAPGVRSRPRI